MGAVIVDTEVLSDPNEIGGIELFSLHEGAPVKVLENKNSYSKIVLPDGKRIY